MHFNKKYDLSFNIDPFTPPNKGNNMPNTNNTNNNNNNVQNNNGFSFKNSNNTSSNNDITPTLTYSNDFTNKGSTDDSLSPSFSNDMNNNNINTNNQSIIMNKQEIDTLMESRYLISLICFELRRFDECEEFLLGKRCSNDNMDNIDFLLTNVPKGVHGICLLAKVYHQSCRSSKAIKMYSKCIEIDSYHVGAIMALCDLGQNPMSNNQSLQSKDCIIPNEHATDNETPNNVFEPNKQERREDSKTQMELVDVESYTLVSSMFNHIFLGYYYLSQYQAKQALQSYLNLSDKHLKSAWVLSQTAKCYFEMTDYNRAISDFKLKKEKYPFDMRGMDYYSTALWHLRKSSILSLLSSHCCELDQLSAETYTVMGNCYSLHKSHDLAIKYFEKASDIDSNYAYAYTLAGHEYVVNEDFDNAQKSFENAIRIDDRHYNAWYGLGNIYQYQQNYKQALHHFMKARMINPNSCILCCCIANIYVLQMNYKKALQCINKALSLSNGNNVSAMFEKANILIKTNKFELAIEEFRKLLLIVPNEWKIHFSLGEVYGKIGRKDQALLSFNRAMSLNPKDKSTIKHALQNVYSNDQMDNVFNVNGRGGGSSNNNNKNRNNINTNNNANETMLFAGMFDGNNDNGNDDDDDDAHMMDDSVDDDDDDDVDGDGNGNAIGPNRNNEFMRRLERQSRDSRGSRLTSSSAQATRSTSPE